MAALAKRVMLVCALVAVAGLSFAGADDYPSKPIRLIVGFTAGAGGDVLARVVAAEMSSHRFPRWHRRNSRRPAVILSACCQLKAIKSPEEIAWIRKTATMQDKIMERVLQEIKPGMKDFEVTALAQYTGHLMGSEQGTFNGASARLGVPSSVMWHRHEQGRTIKPGDHLNLLVENNGPGGFYTEISRTFVFGRASNELRDSFELCKAAQKATVDRLRLGLPCADVFRSHNEYMVAHGGKEEKRLYAHGQGYDLVERPLIRHDETMTIEAGMNLAVHPTLSTSSVFMIVCDNFLMNADGTAEPLHHFTQDLFEL